MPSIESEEPVVASNPASTPQPLQQPRILSYPTQTPAELITQGAEGLLYRSSYLAPSLPCALKYRPSKPYRHPILDARLTRHRILAEARVLVKCRREGVAVPNVYALDESKGWLMMEWIEGAPVRARLNEWLHRRGDAVPKSVEEARTDDSNKSVLRLMAQVGAAVGKLHSIGVVHGDLTTSNLMLRSPSADHTPDGEPADNLAGEVVLIDFGLASQSQQDEDRAVDLYVLERAFGSTHPRTEPLFEEVLSVYGESYKGAKTVLKKLDEVRMRGRKRTMIG